ncbi:MAG: hypothetical protein ACPGFK_00665 [Flavobacteriaceae bacterium]
MNFRFKKAELGIFNTAVSDDVVRKLDKNSRILGLSRGKFSLIDLIRSILKKTGKAHIICTTWSAGIKDAHQIEWLINSKAISSFKLITDHSYKTRQKKYAVTLENLFGVENIRTSEIHAKFVLIHNEDWKVCIRTSMNLNANKTCESFEIDEDEDIFNFYFDFIEHTFETMPKGFTTSSFKANKSLDLFFNTNSNSIKGWNEI